MAKNNETADAGAAGGAAADRPASVLDGWNDPVLGPARMLALEEIAHKYHAREYLDAVDKHAATIRAERGEPGDAA